MKLPINIEGLLTSRSVEWERLEFKAGWNPKAVLHTMCAFANDFHNLGSGYIIIGVGEENGRPVLPPTGLLAKKLDTIQKEIVELGYRIIPYYHPIIAPFEINGRHILVLWAAGGQTRPYKAPVSLAKANRDVAYYIRKGPVTVRARHQDEIELMSLTATIPFDDRINQSAGLNVLDLGLIRSYLKQINSDLFPESASLDFDLLCRQMNIVDGPDESIQPKNIGLMFFNDKPAHFFPQTQIDVVHFPKGAGANSFTIGSFPGPDRSISDQNLRKFRFLSRRYRNRRVGEFLKELEMTEGRGTGIPKIIREIKKNGSPDPIFHTDDDRTFFLVEFPVHPVFAEAVKQKGDTEVAPEVTPEVKRLLRVMTDVHSRVELQEMTRPDKPKSRLQKYRLTAKGLTLKKGYTK